MRSMSAIVIALTPASRMFAFSPGSRSRIATSALVHPPIPVRGTPLIGIGDADVTRVLHGEAESGEALGEAGITDGRRPHVDAAAVSAEIHRHADDRDGLAHATGLAAGWKIATITPSAATSSPT